MPGWELSAAFFVTALLLGISPGPDIIFVLTQSAIYGSRAGIITTFGLATGLCFQTCAVALGIAALVRASPLAFNILRFCGAAYLCWLAWQAFRAKADKAELGVKGQAESFRRAYLRGVIMNITNPKVAVFFLAFLPQFCDPVRGSMLWQIIYFGILFIIATLIVFSIAAWLGGNLANWFNSSPRARLWINRIAGFIFLGLALSLLILDT